MSKPKKYNKHGYNRTCGNCGLTLTEADDVSFVPSLSGNGKTYSSTGSNYFHSTPEGCANASNKPVIIPQGYKQRLYLLDDLL